MTSLGGKASVRSRSGFTLLELLLVTAAAAVLAVLVFTQAKVMLVNAKLSKDAGNLRQIGLACERFAQDHRGHIILGVEGAGTKAYPGEGGVWFLMLRPYLGYQLNGKDTVAVFVSPGDPTKGGLTTGEPAVSRRSYNVNNRTVPTSGITVQNTYRKLAIEQQSQFALIGNHKLLHTPWIDATPGPKGGLSGIPRDWFNGKVNFLFLDGHVESILVDDVLPGGSRAGIFTAGLPKR